MSVKRVGFWVGLSVALFLAGLVICRELSAPRFRDPLAADHCLSNLHQLSQACLMYARDYDFHLPLKRNWTRSVLVYAKNKKVIYCPTAGSRNIGYAMNGEVSGESLEKFANAAIAVVLYDAERGHVAFRHTGGYHAAFADGHVHWEPAGSWDNGRFRLVPTGRPMLPSVSQPISEPERNGTRKIEPLEEVVTKP